MNLMGMTAVELGKAIKDGQVSVVEATQACLDSIEACENYDSAIFTEEKHTSLDKAYQGRKSIVDYVFTDGTAKQSVERKFVEDLDTSTDVAVYAKWPKCFHIPTPVGNYSPDWAIAFKDGAVKHVYFVAETKGSMSTLDLRGIEDGKIACADRLFEQLSGSGIYYHKVTNYDDLMEWVK